MVEQRRHARVSCNSRCDLVNRDGKIFPALLSDISVGGALVTLDRKTRLHEGDLIALKLRDDAAFYPATHVSRILRIDSKNNYGLRFLVNGFSFKNM